MNIEEFIADVKEQLNVHTDDSTVRQRHVYSVGKNWRSELIRQETNKNMLWTGGSAQSFPVTLEESTISEVDVYDADIKVYKSDCVFPELIDTKFGKVILNVFFQNGAALESIEYADWIIKRNRRYKLPNDGYYFFRNKRLYVVDYPGGNGISLNVEGIYESPEEISLACNKECTYMGSLDFAVPGYLKRRITELTADTVRKKYIIANDTRNDSRETVQPTTAQNG